MSGGISEWIVTAFEDECECREADPETYPEFINRFFCEDGEPNHDELTNWMEETFELVGIENASFIKALLNTFDDWDTLDELLISKRNDLQKKD